MRVTTSPTADTVGFDELRAAVGPGEGAVGRFPGIVCVVRCPDPAPVREFLALCAAVAGPAPGRALARRLATWISGPTAPGPELWFGTVAAAGDQLAVFLVGAVDAWVDADDGLTLSGAHAALGTDRLLPRPATSIVLSLDGGAIRPDPADVHDLRAGVVPGSGVVLYPTAFEPERSARSVAESATEDEPHGGHEWFDAGEDRSESLSGAPLGVPEEWVAGRNGSAPTVDTAAPDVLGRSFGADLDRPGPEHDDGPRNGTPVGRHALSLAFLSAPGSDVPNAAWLDDPSSATEQIASDAAPPDPAAAADPRADAFPAERSSGAGPAADETAVEDPSADTASVADDTPVHGAPVHGAPEDDVRADRAPVDDAASDADPPAAGSVGDGAVDNRTSPEQTVDDPAVKRPDPAVAPAADAPPAVAPVPARPERAASRPAATDDPDNVAVVGGGSGDADTDDAVDGTSATGSGAASHAVDADSILFGPFTSVPARADSATADATSDGDDAAHADDVVGAAGGGGTDPEVAVGQGPDRPAVDGPAATTAPSPRPSRPPRPPSPWPNMDRAADPSLFAPSGARPAGSSAPPAARLRTAGDTGAPAAAAPAPTTGRPVVALPRRIDRVRPQPGPRLGTDDAPMGPEERAADLFADLAAPDRSPAVHRPAASIALRDERAELRPAPPPDADPDADADADGPPETGPRAAGDATASMPGVLLLPPAEQLADQPACEGADQVRVPARAAGAAAPALPVRPVADRPAAGRPGPHTARIRGYRCENGHLNDPRSPSCRHCGAPIDERVGGLVAGARPPLGRLVFDDGVAHVVDGGYLVGRMPEVDERVQAGELRPIVVEDHAGSVSRVHAEVRVSGWDVIVVDTGSRNGTFVSGEGEGVWTALPPRRSRRLLPGTRVRMGARMFVFESSSSVR